MIELGVSRLCESLGCLANPSFNYASETKRRFCNKHKLPDMINVKMRKNEDFIKQGFKRKYGN
jgi:hypothetical protein